MTTETEESILRSQTDECDNAAVKASAKRLFAGMTIEQKRQFLLSILATADEQSDESFDSEDDIRGALVAPL